MKKAIIVLLNELRRYILIWLFILFLLFIFCFIWRKNIYTFIIRPLLNYNENYINFFVYTSILESFTTDIFLSFYCSFILSVPFMLILLYKFVAKSLYKNEKKIIFPIFCLSILLFLLSLFISYDFLFPRIIIFFTSFSSIAQPMLKISEYVSTFFYLILTTTLVFQFPIMIILLSRFGFIDKNFLSKNRKFSIVVIFIIAALITPPDIFSQLLVALFLIIFYEITNLFIKKTIK